MTTNEDDLSIATPEDKRLAFEKMADEAGGFYVMTTTITTAFLGGALYFCDKFGAIGPRWSILPLSLGGLLLTIALILLCWIRWNNIQSLQLYLESLQPNGGCAKRRMLRSEAFGRVMTSVALWALAAGLLCLLLFCVACAWTNTNGTSR